MGRLEAANTELLDLADHGQTFGGAGLFGRIGWKYADLLVISKRKAQALIQYSLSSSSMLNSRWHLGVGRNHQKAGVPKLQVLGVPLLDSSCTRHPGAEGRELPEPKLATRYSLTNWAEADCITKPAAPSPRDMVMGSDLVPPLHLN